MNAEKVAIIDVGTNTFHLLIAEINDRDDFLIREKFKEAVKLGEGGIATGQIGAKAFARGLKALKNFRKIINSRGATRVLGFATSAIRSASNGKEFIRKAMTEAEIPIRVINGNEEAALIFEGVKTGVQLPYHDQCLVMDIGGGSVEFIVSFENNPQLLRSLDIGAARMLEKFKPSDPITKDEVEEMRKFFMSEAKGLIKELKEFDLHYLVGSSGAFECIASMIAHQKRDFLATENLNSYVFTKQNFQTVFRYVIEMCRCFHSASLLTLASITRPIICPSSANCMMVTLPLSALAAP